MLRQEIHAILDRSGSMRGKIDDVIGGLKANIDELKGNKDCEIFISIKLFDDKQDIVLKATNVQNISDYDIDTALKNYTPRGSTSLRDALGDSLTFYMTKQRMSVKDFDKCLIYVMTDGMENTSIKAEYQPQKLTQLIKEAEKMNINVIYIGANQDAILEASKFGISPKLSMNYAENAEANISALRAVSAVVHRSLNGGEFEFTPDERMASIGN